MNTGEFKIIGYKTATGANVRELDHAVIELLSEGYEPYGSPYLSDVENRVFYQAMILTNKPRVTIREFAHQEITPAELNVATVTGSDLPPGDITR
jgi:hypothetical protein